MELEPWQEEAHRQLMRLLALNGQWGVALAQCEACQRALAEELEVEPAAETTRLYERIRDGEAAELGPAEGQELAYEAGEAEFAPVGMPEAPALPQRRWGRRMALVGAGALFLVVVGATLVFTVGGGLSIGQAPPFPSAAVALT